MAPERYIGLMSGTSVDAIDAALVEFNADTCALIGHHSEPIPAGLREAILTLCNPGDNEIDRAGIADRMLGEAFAAAVSGLLAKSRCQAKEITAIGSHGQTIRHRPPQPGRPTNEAFTLQIGDPTTIAELTGICTVADFRRRDIAAGGQGAPLVPLFHQACFAMASRQRAVVNIGGMANVSLLDGEDGICGYDTGPGNVLLDHWANLHLGKAYDPGGEWAGSGTVNETLLEAMLEHGFFRLPAPKSTGREDFNGAWLAAQLKDSYDGLAPENIQATLLELTARSIHDSLADSAVDEIYLCGGGVHNQVLVQRLQELSAPRPVMTTAELGIPPDWVEASAFAWLARQCKLGLTGSNSSVTGTRGPRVLGAIYPA